MRKIFLVLITILSMYVAQAQLSDADKNAAVQLTRSHQKELGLFGNDLDNFVVSNSYEDKTTGIRYVYLLQTYKGIIVNNEMQVMAFKNDKILSYSGGRIDHLDQKVDNKTGTPSINAQSAVIAAIADRKLTPKTSARVIKSSSDGQKVEFNDMGISHENITAQLMWVPDSKSKYVYLAWQVYIMQTTSADLWLVRVHAGNGSVIDVDNLTDYDNWGMPSQENSHLHNNATNNKHAGSFNFFDFKASASLSNNQTSSPSLVSGASYRVIPFPAESPLVSPPTLVTNPWTAAPGNATTLKWHTGAGGIDYNYTRGNNVWAYEDRTDPDGGDESNSTHSTTTSDPLNFNFVPNFTVDPTQTSPVSNQQFSTTNLFYWSNVIHDVMYLYGFTEAAANFQDDNMGRGGAGNDHVKAEAQDGSGTNNANFGTPADGGPGRMQMYLWNLNASSPNKDGDLDNGMVVHEYGHGISNRLTGGGTGACLGNIEQMGEGWSDFYALMFTQNWAASNVNSGFTTQRGMGLYVLNGGNLFPTSSPGSGIRHYAYCTNMAVNPLTYADLGGALIGTEPHNIGEIWCATLWDMTWNIIQQENSINPNIYNVAGGGGNVIAMKLVTEGLKLQPCRPGFIDGRNAIIQADINLYGGAHVCAIKEAFRRRGMGTGALQGSPNSANDQTPSFANDDLAITLLQNGVISTPEQQNIIYSNRVVTGPCANAAATYIIRDTLPSNVTFVSADHAGTYNASNRVVSWSFNQAAGSTVDYNFVVNINAGTYYPGVNLISESVAGSSIPASFTAASTTSTQWTVSNAQSHSPTNSFFTADISTPSDQTLATTVSFAVPASPPQLSFWHFYNSENTYDGGVVEISTNGGTTWADIGSSNYIQNGYNTIISAISGSPISGRAAFSGNSSGFIKSIVNMTPYANQANVKLRWRFASDVGISVTGWYVDDIILMNLAHVDMQTGLFNAANIRLAFSDTTMLVTPFVPCEPPTISYVNITNALCPNPTGTLVVDAAASGPIEYSADNGNSWQSSNTFNGLLPGHYDVKVRLQTSPTCIATYQFNEFVDIISASSISVNSIIGNPANCTVSTGGINVSASSPNGSVEYTVDGGTTWYPAGTYIGGLMPGNYPIQMRLVEYPQCTLSTGTTVNPAPTLPEFNTLSVVYGNCYNVNGGIGATASSPSDAVEISLDGITWSLSSYVNSAVPPGNYTLTARLVNFPACSTTTAVYVPTPPSLPVFGTVTVTDASCAVPTGSIAATATSGSEAVQVSVDGTTWYTSGTAITGLTTGSYTLRARLQNSPACIQQYGTPLVISSITAIPAMPAAVQGLTNVCPYVGSTTQLTYSVPVVPGASSYNWTVPVTTTLVSGQGTNSITVTINSNFFSNPNRMFRVTASNSCGTSAERLFYITAQFPNTPLPITASSTDICAAIGNGTSITYSIPPVIAATSYLWTVQDGTTTISHPNGQGSINDTIISVTFSSGFTSSSISVQAVNTCLGSGLRSLALTRKNAGTPGLITGPGNPCENIAPNGTAAVYSVPAQSNTIYTWTVPAGAVSVNGQGTNTISFIYPAGFTSGTLSVTATNGCGTSDARTKTVTRLNPSIPSPIDVIQTHFCGEPGGRVFTYSLSAMPANSTSVLWTVPATATIINGQGTISITVSYPDGSVSGSVTAQAMANCAFSSIRSTTVKLPACPPPAFTGTDKSNNTRPSNQETKTAGGTLDIKISPNPAVSDFRLEVSSVKKEMVIITVIDSEGKLYKTFRIMPNQSIRMGEELKPGSYLVEAIQGTQVKTTKVIRF